jgi:hypothetical protein
MFMNSATTMSSLLMFFFFFFLPLIVFVFWHQLCPCGLQQLLEMEMEILFTKENQIHIVEVCGEN